jgi:rSAM/selenodomain-associated transferase 1
MDTSNCRIIVFTKAPIAGQVKTRLIPALGAQGAAELHKRLTVHRLDTASGTGITIDLWCTPSIQHEFFSRLQARYSVNLFQQQGRDLGERMAFAFEASLQRSHKAVLVGTDCPQLDNREIMLAFDRLEQGDDAVISPAEDGGYGLLGLRRFNNSIFMGVEWGTANVLEHTRNRLVQLRWKWTELDTCWDVDRTEDLPRLEKLDSSFFANLPIVVNTFL